MTRSKTRSSAAGSDWALEAMAEAQRSGGNAAGGGEQGRDLEISDAVEESDGGAGVSQALELVMVEGESAYGGGKGKSKAKMVVEDELQAFRLFDLPTEIRLEIYKACLTRPENILLSRVERPASRIDDEDENAVANGSSRTTANRAGSSQGSPSRRRGGARSATLRSSTRNRSAHLVNTRNTQRTSTPIKSTPVYDTRPRMEDPLIPAILRTSKEVYKEARDVLYGENNFTIDLYTARSSLAALHQRSRGRIRHIDVLIPAYTEILESFSETVRLSLRYCSGLRRLVVHTPFQLPGPDANGVSTGNTAVYANGFDILRWLPRGCEVVMEGKQNKEIEVVVQRHMALARTQDSLAYARRQLLSNEPDAVAEYM